MKILESIPTRTTEIAIEISEGIREGTPWQICQRYTEENFKEMSKELLKKHRWNFWKNTRNFRMSYL